MPRTVQASVSSADPVLSARGILVRRDGATLLGGVDLEVRDGRALGAAGRQRRGQVDPAGACWAPAASRRRARCDVLGSRLGRVPVHDLWPLIGQVHSGHVPSGRLTARQVGAHRPVGTAALPLRWQPSPALTARVDALLATLGVDRLADHPWTDAVRRRARPGPGRPRARQRPAAAAARRARRRAWTCPPASSSSTRSTPSPRPGPTARACSSPTTWRSCRPAPRTPLLLRGGRLLAAGPVEQVLTGPLLSACFALDLSVRREHGRWSARSVRSDLFPGRQEPGGNVARPHLTRRPRPLAA